MVPRQRVHGGGIVKGGVSASCALRPQDVRAGGGGGRGEEGEHLPKPSASAVDGVKGAVAHCAPGVRDHGGPGRVARVPRVVQAVRILLCGATHGGSAALVRPKHGRIVPYEVTGGRVGGEVKAKGGQTARQGNALAPRTLVVQVIACQICVAQAVLPQQDLINNPVRQAVGRGVRVLLAGWAGERGGGIAGVEERDTFTSSVPREKRWSWAQG